MKQNFDNVIEQISSLSSEEIIRLQAGLDIVLRERAKQADEMSAESRSNRLSFLRTYKAQQDAAKEVEQHRLSLRKEALHSQIEALRPRIADLINTVEACVENDIRFPRSLAMDYHSNSIGLVNSVGFVSIGVHLDGQYENWYLDVKETHINFAGGDILWHGPKPEMPVEYLEKFCVDFDGFETAFYAYVDKAIEEKGMNQEARTVSLFDKLADATARSEATLGGAGRGKDEYVMN